MEEVSLKRQVIIIVVVTLVSFLAGTLFSMVSTATGIIANPFSQSVIGTSKSSPQLIRFQSPNEIFIPAETNNQTRYHTIAVANFTWTPENSLNNAILSAYSWAEFKSLTDGGVTVDRRLAINGIQSEPLPTFGNSVGNSTYRFSQFQPWMSNGVYPSSIYAIQYRVTLAFEDQVYIRNINVILIVVDEP